MFSLGGCVDILYPCQPERATLINCNVYQNNVMVWCLLFVPSNFPSWLSHFISTSAHHIDVLLIHRVPVPYIRVCGL